MLTIVFARTNYTRKPHEISWHVGEKIPATFLSAERRVDVLQADCHELVYIREHFTNIPMCDNRPVVRWFGDIANFIAHCLPLDYSK